MMRNHSRNLVRPSFFLLSQCRWGLIVASHPLKVILVTILLTGICSGGFYYFRTEADAEKLWLPSDSTYLANKKWKKENYKEGTRDLIQ